MNAMNNYFELDGKDNGIVIYVYQNEDFIRNKEGKLILFKNLGLAKVWLSNVMNISDPHLYKVMFELKNTDEMIDFEDVYTDEDYYQYHSKITGMIFIKPTITEKVIRLGYFVFESGDRVLSDKAYGIKRSRQLFFYIKEALTELLNDNQIEYITVDKNNHICAKVKGSTACIHACYNNQIMTLNQTRREYGVRCLPYEKSMDKFLTIYTYITCDISEPKFLQLNDKAIEIHNQIAEIINNHHSESEPRYIGVEFNGTIVMI